MQNDTAVFKIKYLYEKKYFNCVRNCSRLKLRTIGHGFWNS